MNLQHYDELEPQYRKELGRNASIPPPVRLDRIILRRIRRRPVLKPFLAGGMAVAGLISIVTWLAVAYAASESALPPVPTAVITALIYLAFCSVATLPLMMFPGRFGLGIRTAKETT